VLDDLHIQNDIERRLFACEQAFRGLGSVVYGQARSGGMRAGDGYVAR
jgi:hypothetical protein